VLAVTRMFHLMIAGMSRFGKSVLLHCILSQLLPKPSTMVERLILCDLKGAVELGQYGKTHPDRVKVFRDVPGVMVVVRELMRSWTRR
jgi:DNA segregation ATPase FtsK/SpoIIIE-like protein